MEAVDGFFGLIALIVLHANRGKSVDAGARHSHSDAGRIPIHKESSLLKRAACNWRQIVCWQITRGCRVEKRGASKYCCASLRCIFRIEPAARWFGLGSWDHSHVQEILSKFGWESLESHFPMYKHILQLSSERTPDNGLTIGLRTNIFERGHPRLSGYGQFREPAGN